MLLRRFAPRIADKGVPTAQKAQEIEALVAGAGDRILVTGIGMAHDAGGGIGLPWPAKSTGEATSI